jgi:hypothetical protein
MILMLETRDFTLRSYQKLCDAITASRYRQMTFRQYFQEGSPASGIILLRHDVDENIRFSLDMAELEHLCGIKSTYYFRMRKKIFVPSAMDRIASLGHEIGYHYETLDKCSGHMDEAIKLFSAELEVFRRKYDVKTAVMHGNPLSRYDNRDIWKNCKVSDFGLLGEPYLSLDYGRFAYYSDSGRSWSSEKLKIKDTVRANQKVAIKTTQELAEVLDRLYPMNVCILTHPERWNKNVPDYMYRLMIDSAYIMGKKVISLAR